MDQEASQKYDSSKSDVGSGKCREYKVPPFANCRVCVLAFGYGGLLRDR